jgi:hypothetical protein
MARRSRCKNLQSGWLAGVVACSLAATAHAQQAPAQSGVAGDPASIDARYAQALESAERRMTAERLRTEERIVLDGVLDEAPWKRAVPASDFIQQDPILGGTPTEATEVRIVFNRRSLYMGVTCFDSEPDKLLGNTMKRDEFLGGDDRFMWTMDTFLDRQTGYFFEMNPSGLMADSLMGASGDNRNWDGIWNAKVRKSEIGWTIEIEIPFSTLNFDSAAPAWGVNFQRTIRRKNEENLWTGHQRNQGLRRMSNAGLLLGIRDVSQGLGLDVRPFAAASLADSPGRAEPRPATGNVDVGLDLFYSVTPSLRTNVTINTDFGETEVDQRLVNLTRFPLFYPEKRTFFLDGASFLDFYRGAGGPGGGGGGGGGGGFGGGGGAGPSPVRPYFSRRIGRDDAGQQQPIDVGAKVTGQVGRQDVGVLYVRTGETATTPAEDFGVVRLKRRFWAQSYLAGIYTGRRTPGQPTRSTAGLDFRLATSRFRERQNLEFDTFMVWTSDVAGLGENLSYGARAGFPNDPWNASVSYEVVEEHVDPAVGFVPRTGFKNLNPRIGYQPRPQNHPWIRRLDFSLAADLLTDMNNRWLTREIDWQVLRVETHAQDGIGFSVAPEYQRLEEDFEISDGIVLPAGGVYDFLRYRIGGNTANRRVVGLRGGYEWGGFYSGTRRQANLNLNVRPRPGVRVQLEGEWNDVTLAEGRFQTRVYRLLTDTQFSPWIFIVNNVQYDTVSGVLGWQSRFRWTLRPGDDLFFTYTHNWIDDGLDDRFRTLDRRGAIKLVYGRRF